MNDQETPGSAAAEPQDSEADRGPITDYLKKLLGGSGAQTPAPPAAPSAPAIPVEKQPMQPAPTTERDWTILLYMAGDNGKVFQTKYESVAEFNEQALDGEVCR